MTPVTLFACNFVMNSKPFISALTRSAIVLCVGVASAQNNPTASGTGPAPTAQLDPLAVQTFVRDLQQRAELINRLTDRYQSEAAAQFGTSFSVLDWRREFGTQMIYQSVQSLGSALTAPNLSMAQNELFNAHKMILKHTFGTDLRVNVLSLPCRIVDTRLGGGGPLGPAWRYWSADDTPANIAAQGGNAAGCSGSLPLNSGTTGAQGWILYVTVVPRGPGGPDFLTVQHDAAPTPPTSSTMNYYGQNIANFAVVADFDPTSGTGHGFNAYASTSTNVVIDLVGYTARSQNTAALDCTELDGASTPIAANGTVTASSPSCATGYTVTGGNCRAADYGVNVVTSTSQSTLSNWFCAYNNYNSVASSVEADVLCCRVPSGI